MKRLVTVMIPALFTIGLASPALSQTYVPPPLRIVGLSGPRFGVTVLDRGVLDRLEERAITVRPVISQFGWQLEKQFFSASSGLTALNEWVLLVGGLEQGVALPSATWMVGIRTSSGTEFGVGPNITPAGLALVSTIISLAHALRLKVVAEGVETEEQSRLLRLLNCDAMQGFLISKPVPADAFESSFLRAPAARAGAG